MDTERPNLSVETERLNGLKSKAQSLESAYAGTISALKDLIEQKHNLPQKAVESFRSEISSQVQQMRSQEQIAAINKGDLISAPADSYRESLSRLMSAVGEKETAHLQQAAYVLDIAESVQADMAQIMSELSQPQNFLTPQLLEKFYADIEKRINIYENFLKPLKKVMDADQGSGS